MKHKKTLLCSLLLISCLILVTSMPVFAAELTEAEVQQAVDAQGKETVTGNVFIWFLCAIAFLKVSQKIDSFMASLGVNVGNTGGNMMAELLIAGRGLAIPFEGMEVEAIVVPILPLPEVLQYKVLSFPED